MKAMIVLTIMFLFYSFILFADSNEKMNNEFLKIYSYEKPCMSSLQNTAIRIR